LKRLKKRCGVSGRHGNIIGSWQTFLSFLIKFSRIFKGRFRVFSNDKYPRATNPEGSLQTEDDWKVETTLFKKGASIGFSSTILCNVTIGENAIVGAGSLVTKDVPPNTIVAGNPVNIFRRIDEGRTIKMDVSELQIQTGANEKGER
jgi:hypothetical protein